LFILGRLWVLCMVVRLFMVWKVMGGVVSVDNGCCGS